MDKFRLVNIKWTRAEFLTDDEKKKYDITATHGLVAIETRLDREISIKEVDEIVEAYKISKESAYDLYEKRIEETIDIVSNSR